MKSMENKQFANTPSTTSLLNDINIRVINYCLFRSLRKWEWMFLKLLCVWRKILKLSGTLVECIQIDCNVRVESWAMFLNNIIKKERLLRLYDGNIWHVRSFKYTVWIRFSLSASRCAYGSQEGIFDGFFWSRSHGCLLASDACTRSRPHDSARCISSICDVIIFNCKVIIITFITT